MEQRGKEVGHRGGVEEEYWKNILEFPMYSVSSEGRVRRDSSGRMLMYTENRYGVVCVGLMRDRKQCNRSVPLLVAKAFIRRDPHRRHFDATINLNGNRWDNRKENLAWRPRWFAVEYNRQFRNPYPNPINRPIREEHTGRVFGNSLEVALEFGLLEKDVVLSILNNTIVLITFQKFEVVE